MLAASACSSREGADLEVIPSVASDLPPMPEIAPIPVFVGTALPTLPPGVPSSCQVLSYKTYINQTLKYCLAVPAQFTLEELETGTLSILGPALDETSEPPRARMWLNVTPVDPGKTLDQLIDEFLAQNPGNIERRSATLGGEPAEILGASPGQLGARDAFVLYQEYLYHLRFEPSIGDSPRGAVDMEGLFTAIFDTFGFLP